MDGDYYSAVYAWFERCGIISNIRTHLRQNLVNALKNKDMTLNKANIPPKSAKQYVYDLLIAEYLWNLDYAYTLSVFASEAPLLINFRKHVKKEEAIELGDRNKLQSDYVCHTLETLGINPQEADGQAIITDYDNNDIPLLLSIFKYISQFKRPKSVQIIRENFKVPTKNSKTQTDFPKKVVTAEALKIVAAKRKLLSQKEAFDNELKEKEEALKKRAGDVEQQMSILDEKLAKVQGLMEAVNLKEKQLNESKKEDERRIYRRELELSVRENSLVREAERIEKERESYKLFEAHLKNLQEELAKIKQDLPGGDRNEKISTTEVSTQTEKCSNEINVGLSEQEKQDLEALVHEQKLRIEELTLRAVRLSRQLEEAHLFRFVNSSEIMKPIAIGQSSKTVLSESSSTDDIIQDAKQRLKRLEEETSKADQCYLNSITLPL